MVMVVEKGELYHDPDAQATDISYGPSSGLGRFWRRTNCHGPHGTLYIIGPSAQLPLL